MISLFPKNWVSKQLLTWFAHAGRHHLPWKTPRSAYKTWISEIMLQQTQVATVIPYFERFIDRFPTIYSLATADLDTILQYWAGLGYYARGRNLHACAQQLLRDYEGKIPADPEILVTLPGIGRSTAGAIVAQSYNQHAVILDGNVKRVLTRLHCLTPDNKQSAKIFENHLWDIATHYTPKKQVDDYTQAIMDLGATVCTRTRPRCDSCPLSTKCLAHLNQRQADFPAKKASKIIPIKQLSFLVICKTQKNKKNILLYKRPSTGIWGGLWSLPELAYPVTMKAIESFLSTLSTPSQTKTKNQFKIANMMKGEIQQHIFTHYKLNFQPVYITLKNNKSADALDLHLKWCTMTEIRSLGLPAPIKRILEKLDNLDNINKIKI